jgi:hypothetical protein
LTYFYKNDKLDDNSIGLSQVVLWLSSVSSCAKENKTPKKKTIPLTASGEKQRHPISFAKNLGVCFG